MEELKLILKQKLSVHATAKKVLKKISPFFIASTLTFFSSLIFLFFYPEFLLFSLGLGLLTYLLLYYRINFQWNTFLSTLPPEEQEYIEKHFKKLSRSKREEKKAYKLVKHYQTNRPLYCERHYKFYCPELEDLLHQKIIHGEEVFFVRSLKLKSKERQEVNALMKK